MPGYTYRFTMPEYVEQEIIDKQDNRVGVIRVRPAGIMWKPVGAHKFTAVSLQDFIDWITTNPKAKFLDR